jgi:phage terminase large subunit
MNSLADSSFAEVKAAILEEPWLAANYDVGKEYIRTADGRIEFAFIGLRHNIESVKSKARIHLLWVDEAEQVSELAWSVGNSDRPRRRRGNLGNVEPWPQKERDA